MKTNPPNQGVLSGNFTGIGPATRAMARERARELSTLAGRGPEQVTQADYERAKRELTGESDLDRQDALFDALPESKRWDPVPGSAGRQFPESPSAGEDDEGRNESAQFVEKGAVKAERDRRQRAAREEEKIK